jgi:hypothetical protein
MVAAINTYGPGMTVWGAKAVLYLVRVCEAIATSSSVVDPAELSLQSHTVPEIIRYARRVVATSAPEES